MARQREPMTLIPADDVEIDRDVGYDGDAEQAWEKWGEALHQAENPGSVRVAKLPLDEKGAPQVNVKGQIQLGSWPFDQYTFEELLAKIRQDFMKAGETIAIRITGTSAGERGVKFNRVVMVQKPSGTGESSNQLGEVLRAMQESQNAQAQMLERILQPRQGDGLRSNNDNNLVDSLVKLSPLLAPVIAALTTRMMTPATTAGNGLTEMLSGLEKLMTLREMVSGGQSNEESNTLGIIKAVAPQGLSLLTELVKKQNENVRSPSQRPAIQSLPAPVGSSPNALAPHLGAVPAAQPANGNVSRENSAISSEPIKSESKDMLLAQIAPQIEQLAVLAETGTPAMEAAKLMLDMLPGGAEGEALDQVIYNLISDKARFGRLRYLSRKFAAHESWFEELRLELLKEFETDAEHIDVESNVVRN